MVRVKICGITSAADARSAARAGADAVGLNFVGGPRRIDADRAADILEAVPPMCTPVALVDVSGGDVPADLLEVLGRYWVSHLQLYGKVEPATIARLITDGFRPILVQHVAAGRFPQETAQLLGALSTYQPAVLLLDAHVEGMAGGTGQPADWDMIVAARRQMSEWPPMMLAGGLNPDNVADAVRIVQPWAVDVSSGVEASVGRKDPDKMAAFVAAARAATSD